ncbi:MAG: c-type cytochrome [Bacteroidia bacterium]|nr:c-type cytochrome [Bacteroidia bacterium]MBT8277161.1 c-type cytochrome [Bacteroidia bacterium]NNK55602.1 c-type cytochrome [Flavobacteriaceae bacterium]NNM08276.1 c-type cytochrome [Flavobacteriaceae bacterium]
MKTSTYFSFYLLFMVLLTSCSEKKQSYASPDPANLSEAELIEKGEYLIENMGCAHCHTPKRLTEKGPVPDMDRWLMGYPASDSLPKIDPNMIESSPWLLFHPDLTAAVGPWGTSFAGNLTPDDTGIGNWTLDQFKKALREGKYKGMDQNRPMMPPMPVFSSMKDGDLKAMFTYLKSIPPIENVPPSYRPPSQ